MSSHSHSTDSHQHYYEGDQSKLYSGLLAHHTDIESPESKSQIKKIWKVFWILLVITLVEVAIGMLLSHTLPKALIIFIFLSLTLLKAGYIVAIFMHLADEFKGFMITVLVPLFLFVWFIIAFLFDGNYWLNINKDTTTRNQVIEKVKD
jgi:cytochrome c oxidase subunit IV